LAGETEVLGENLPQRYFVHYKSNMIRPGTEPRPPQWEIAAPYSNSDSVYSRNEKILCEMVGCVFME
jgi:hypothetical protein